MEESTSITSLPFILTKSSPFSLYEILIKLANEN